MANSFEILRARIVLDASQVRAAIRDVEQLQGQLKSLKTKINLGTVKLGAATAGNANTKTAVSDVKALNAAISQTISQEKSVAAVIIAHAKILADAAKAEQAAAKLKLDEQNKLLGLEQQLAQIRLQTRRRELSLIQRAADLEFSAALREADAKLRANNRELKAAEQLADRKIRAEEQAEAKRVAGFRKTAAARKREVDVAFREAKTATDRLAAEQKRQQGKAERSATRAKRESFGRVLRAVQGARLGIDPADAAALEKINRLQQILINLQKRTTAGSKAWLAVRRQLAALDQSAKKFQPVAPDANRLMAEATARLRAMLQTAALASRAFANAPGLPRFVSQLARVGAGALSATGSLARLISLTPLIGFSLAGLATAAVFAVSGFLKLVSAAARLAFAFGRAALVGAIRVLSVTLRALLAPTFAAVAALQRLFSIHGLRAFSEEVLDVAIRLDQVRNQLRFAFGREAEAEFARLSAEANLFGTSLLDVSEAFGRFVLSVKGSGIAINTVRRLFTGVQAVTRVFGIEPENVKLLLKALQDVASKGSAASEELKRQLGNALPGAFSLAARALKISTAQLVENLKKGKITAKQFLDAFSEELIRSFYQQAISLTDTLSARLGRLRNLAELARAKLGQIVGNTIIFGIERLVQAFLRVQGAFAFITNAIDPLVAAFQRLFLATNFERLFVILAESIERLLPSFVALVTQLGRLTTLLNVSLVAAGIGALAALLPVVNTGLELMFQRLSQITGIDLTRLNGAIKFGGVLMQTLLDVSGQVFQVIKTLGEVALELLGDIGRVLLNVARVALHFAVAFGKISQSLGPILSDSVAVLEDQLRALTTELPELGKGLQQSFKEAWQKNVELFEDTIQAPQEIPAAKQIKQAATQLKDAITTKPGKIVDFEDLVKANLAAGVQVAASTSGLDADIELNTDRSATATEELVSLFRNPRLVTPFVGQAGGVPT